MTASTREEKDTAALVRAAAEQLLREGRRREITGRGILAHIQYGSLSTIQKALDEWWTDLGRRVDEHGRLPGIPEALQAQLGELITTIQRTAEATARQGLAAYERQADERVRVAEAKVETLVAAKQAAEQRAQGLAERVDTQDERIRGLESLLAAEQARREAAETRAAEARHDAEQARGQAAEQVMEIKRQQALEQERFTALETRLVSQMDEHKSARHRLEKALQEGERLWREGERDLREQITGLEQGRVKMEAERAAMARDIAVLTEEKQRLVQQLQQLEPALQGIRSELDQERLRGSELQANLAAAERSRLELEARGQRLEGMLLAAATPGRAGKGKK